LQFTRRYYSYGEFELNLDYNIKNSNYLQKGNFILLGTDYNKVGIIKHIEITLNDSGEENLKILGYTPDFIFNQRIILPTSSNIYDLITGNSETVIKHYINNCITYPKDTNRKINIFNLTDNQNRGNTISWQSRYSNLLEELNKICVNTNVGIEVTFNNGVFDIDIVEGKNLTTSQSLNTPVIFSSEYDNIKSQSYVNNDLNYKNYAFVGGSGEGVNRKIATYGTSTGIDRLETFIDANDLSTTEQLKEKGKQNLALLKKVQTFESDILSYNTFVYETDWDLGDIVTIQNKKWGLTLNTRITEIKEIHESKGFKLQVTFGNSIPTLMDIVKNKITKINN
jgi:flavin-binding protein dodecin